MQENALVHVVDHDARQRIALSRLLRSVGYDTSLYASADEFIEAKRPDNPSCVVTDVRLPGRSGLDLQHSLSGLRNSPPVILMTAAPDVQMSVKCMKAGAIDFLTKPLRDQDVLDAVAEALESDRKRRAASTIIFALETRFEQLSRRERQVMALVTTGKMNKEVATALALSEVTVKIYRGSVMKKMAAASLADLVKMAQVLEPQLQLA
jgi:FixJ family two-component response regulator